MQDIYASGSRQITIDVLRGYFILSMAAGHLSVGLISNLLHVWVWVDGAVGFVSLSGFVLGLSQRAKWARGAGGAAQLWILRRAAQIWMASVALTLAGLSTRLFSDLEFIEDVFGRERLPSATLELFFLQIRIVNFGILSMYVLFLLVSYFAIAALRRKLDVVVLSISFVVYVAAQLAEQNSPPSEDPSFIYTAWQFLFFVGLVAGWRWRDTIEPAVSARQTSIFVGSAVGVAVFLALAHASKIPYMKELELDLWPYFLKFTLSPAVIVYFIFVLAFLACVVDRLRHVTPLRPVLNMAAMFGRHSLACFLLLSLLQVIVWVITTPAQPDGGRHIAWFGGAVVLFTLYCFAAERVSRMRSTTRRALAR